ncbi:sulfotransferase domain-containing protein [Rubripirellula amarantea]|nr:sulfotransferase domain-containing protein [Rubripirellula amarantea]
MNTVTTASECPIGQTDGAQTSERRFDSLAVCVGSPKCGTTWLDAILREQMPERFPVGVKETFFLDREYHRGVSWYAKLFQSDCKRPIEIAPSYLNCHEGPERLSNLANSVRVLIFVRDPYDRAASDLLHSVGRGRFWINNDDPSDTELSGQVAEDAESYSLYDVHTQRWLSANPDFLAVVPFPIRDAKWFRDVIAKFINDDPDWLTEDWVEQQVNRRVYGSAIPRNRVIAFLTKHFRLLTPRSLRKLVRNNKWLYRQNADADLRSKAKEMVQQFDFRPQQDWLEQQIGDGWIGKDCEVNGHQS